MEEDQELIELRKKRDELLEKAFNLRDKLSEKRSALKTKETIINIDTINDTINPSKSEDSSYNTKSLPKLIKLTQNALGINYNNIEKLWIKDKVWLYKAHVSMKTLSFKLNLTVDKEDDEDKILDITCQFIELDSSLMQEISPWVRTLTKLKNFSYLMSVFSEYNEQSIYREKILNQMKKKKFITVSQHTEEGGGMFIYIHSPKIKDKFYAEYIWTLHFNPKTRSIDHHFLIDSKDDDFINANHDLIKDFCKSGLTKDDLERLWGNLCSAINEYE